MKQTLATLAALAAIGAAHGAPKERPNVILLMSDQQRFDFLGTVNPNIITPNLDALAADGVQFVNGYSSTPSSTPARSGLLTGQAPWHHGMIGYYAKVAPHYPIELPQLLTDAGYYSYGIGKMHWHPQRALHGFANTELDESGRVEDPGFVSDYRQWFARVAPGLNPDSSHIDWNGHAAAVYPLADTLHPTWWTGERAVQFIRNYDKSQPLFLKVSFARPHSPYDPPRRYLDQYADVPMPAPATGGWGSSYSARYAHNPQKNPTAAYGDFGEEYALNSRRHYAANVTFVDEQIGRVIEALKEKGLYDNSIIIFISDHGDMLGDHYHWRKTYAYEGSSHIPFIVRYPEGMKAKVKRGTTRDELVEIRDILPTFLDAAGAEIPQGVDGQSILELLRDPKKAEWRTQLDLEHSSCYGGSGWVGLVDGRYKYIWFYGNGQEQLFDLKTDPNETRDLHADPAQAERMAAFRKSMACHLSERGDKWVSPDGQLLVNKNVPVLTPNYPKPEGK